MIWLILIAIDLMFFLFQRLQKQNLRSLPLIGGKVLILSFNILQKWASRCEKVGSVMLASESEVGQTWSIQMMKNILQLQNCFLLVHYIWSDFPVGSTLDGRKKQGW